MNDRGSEKFEDEEVLSDPMVDEEGEGPTTTAARGTLVYHRANSGIDCTTEPQVTFSGQREGRRSPPRRPVVVPLQKRSASAPPSHAKVPLVSLSLAEARGPPARMTAPPATEPPDFAATSAKRSALDLSPLLARSSSAPALKKNPTSSLILAQAMGPPARVTSPVDTGAGLLQRKHSPLSAAPRSPKKSPLPPLQLAQPNRPPTRTATSPSAGVGAFAQTNHAPNGDVLHARTATTSLSHTTKGARPSLGHGQARIPSAQMEMPNSSPAVSPSSAAPQPKLNPSGDAGGPPRMQLCSSDDAPSPHVRLPHPLPPQNSVAFCVEDAHVVGEPPLLSPALYTVEEGDEETVDNRSCVSFRHNTTIGTAMSPLEMSQHPPFEGDAEVQLGVGRVMRINRFCRFSLIFAAAVTIISGSVMVSSHITRTRTNRSRGNNRDSSGAPADAGAAEDDDSKFWADSDEAIAYLRELRFKVLGIDTFRAGNIQLMATEWMTYTDTPPQGTRIPLDDLVRVQQRYALLIFHFSHGGGKGWDQMRWAEPGLHECEWVGVECNMDGRVIEVNLGAKNVDLTGVLVEEIGLLSSLTSLNLELNRFEGSLPTIIYSLTNLVHLHLSHNEFAGSLHDSFQMLPNLEELRLNSNYLTGTFPASLHSLKRLRVFDVETNRFDGEVWNFLPSWPKIEDFSIATNAVGGTIPTELSKLSHLSSLYFSYTATEGTFPTEIALLTSLTKIENRYASMEGPIPTQIGKLSLLEVLALRGVHMVNSKIPTELGLCTALVELDLFSNFLTGAIPSELGVLTNVLSVNLKNNRFQGTIPSEMARLSNLEYLNVDGFSQDLTGTMPGAFCRQGLRLYAPAEVECDCCQTYRQ